MWRLDAKRKKRSSPDEHQRPEDRKKRRFSRMVSHGDIAAMNRAAGGTTGVVTNQNYQSGDQ